jgi:soluble lytic murein transglycosylase-like protein
MLVKMRERIERGLGLAAIALWIFVCFPDGNAQSARLDQGTVGRARLYEPMIRKAALKHDVDKRVLWVIAYLETGFDHRLVSRKGARGIMQFMPDTSRRFGLSDPHDPAAAIDAASRYIRFLQSRFDNRLDLMLAAYNSGEGTVEAYLHGRPVKVGDRIINPRGLKTGGVPPYRETREYVKRGMKLLLILPAKGPADSVREIVRGKPNRVENALVQKSIRMNSRPTEP